MDHRELKKLVQLMNENGLVELEIEREGERLHLRKAEPAAQPPPYAQFAPPAPQPLPGGGPLTPPAAAAGEGAAVAPAVDPRVRLILSPLVGTFYQRPAPDQDPYVKVGTLVDEDSVVCIVEAMKVNNEIKAELEGEILEVLVEDGQPVEFDQPLFRVRV